MSGRNDPAIDSHYTAADVYSVVTDALAGAGIDLNTATVHDLAPIDQPEKSLLAIYTAVARLDDFALTGLNAATAASGSVIIGLALYGGRLDANEAFALSQLDEQYQRDQWGEDAEATARAETIHRTIVDASSFMALSRAA